MILNNGGDQSLNPVGSQYGRLRSDKNAAGDDWVAPSEVSATLAFDTDGGNGGIITMDWYQRWTFDGTSGPNAYLEIMDRNGNKAVSIRFRAESGAIAYIMYTDGGTSRTPAGVKAAWYHQRITLDYDTKKVTAFERSKGTYSGGTWSWAAWEDLFADHDKFLNGELAFLSASSDSFDTLCLNTEPSGGSDSYFHFDNITVPEPATMVLLGLGGVGLLVRRRRRA